MNSILVISPHPDDEAIGCGGAISLHTSQGDLVEVVFLTSGENGGHGKPPELTKVTREGEAREAGKILGINKLEFWEQPDGALKADQENVDRLVRKIEEIKPSILFVTHDHEQHPDHLAAAELVRKALGKLDQNNKQPEVWMYEVWTPLERMDTIIDISDYVDQKKKAILAHKSQCDVVKFHESALALNRYRGEMHCWPGGDYAEVFKTMNP